MLNLPHYIRYFEKVNQGFHFFSIFPEKIFFLRRKAKKRHIFSDAVSASGQTQKQ